MSHPTARHTSTARDTSTGTVESVVLLDDDHQPIGTAPKADVHGPDTPLHLAFSVYVVHPDGRFLATRRALDKRTWGGVWTNSCCGHPGPGEDLATAARRRLEQELGLVASTLTVALPNFRYRARSPEGLWENEYCPVFVATVGADPVPDPSEVVQWQWVAWSDFRESVERTPWAFSPWSVLQTRQLGASLLAPGPSAQSFPGTVKLNA